MKIDAKSCYQAVISRDPRFDGSFFTAVVTTGIYCRPICPARAPKPENVRFYVCAAAAEEAGFRPCRRCRPDTAPGTPAWRGTSATVGRALRLISEGALNEDDLEGFALRMGISARHLRRLFQDELGASPIAIAQTRRVHFARKLLEETALPITEVAFSSGFSSIRRFNDVALKHFGETPKSLRKSARGQLPVNGKTLRLRVPYRPPLDWSAFVNFIGPRAIPGVEVIDQASYQRTFEIQALTGVLEVRPDFDRPWLNLLLGATDSRVLGAIVEGVKRLFDCGADPAVINDHLGRDPVLQPLVRLRPGLRIPGAFNRFELAVRCIIGQQISVRGATTIAGRLVSEFGIPLERDQASLLAYAFPRPEVLAAADLGRIGLTRKRAQTINTLAGCLVEDPHLLTVPGNAGGMNQNLLRIPGIGNWTAQYIAMRAFGDPDAFPASDLGLRRAASPGGLLLSEKDLSLRSEAWRPWRAYGAMHLWASLP